MKKSIIFAIVAALLALAFLFAREPGRSPQPSDGAPEPQYETLATGLDVPWSLVFVSPDRYLVTERSGNVVLGAIGDAVAPMRIPIPNVLAAGEGGLLGIALHPQFAENHLAYVYYTYREGQETLNRVARFVFEHRALREDRVIIDQIPGSANHNGGRIAFGPDGMLYITTGDAQIPELAQDKNSLAGKILRLTPDGGIPPDNPFPNSPVYSFGHRNPQGLAWNRDGYLYASEHGSSAHDEINIIRPGKNYGWPLVRGAETREGLEAPFLESGSETWAPSGMSFFEDELFFAGLRGQSLYRARFTRRGPELAKLVAGEFGRLRDIVKGPDGFLYLVTSNRDGRGSPSASDDRIIKIAPELLL